MRQSSHTIFHVVNSSGSSEQGARVTAHYNTNSNTLGPLTKEFGAEKVQIAQADLALEADVIRLFASTSESLFGPVAIVVINHGISPRVPEPVVAMAIEQWKTTLDANLTASFLVAREYLRHLQQAGEEVKSKTSILFVGSTAGKFGEDGNAAYAASKSGASRPPPNVKLRC